MAERLRLLSILSRLSDRSTLSGAVADLGMFIEHLEPASLAMAISLLSQDAPEPKAFARREIVLGLAKLLQPGSPVRSAALKPSPLQRILNTAKARSRDQDSTVRDACASVFVAAAAAMDDVGHPQATGDGGNPVIRALLDLMSDRGRAEQHVGSYALGRVVHFTGGLDQSIIKTLVKMLYSPTFLARGSLIATFARMESLGQSGALNTPPGTLAPRSRPGSPRRTFGESSAPQPAGLVVTSGGLLLPVLPLILGAAPDTQGAPVSPSPAPATRLGGLLAAMSDASDWTTRRAAAEACLALVWALGPALDASVDPSTPSADPSRPSARVAAVARATRFDRVRDVRSYGALAAAGCRVLQEYLDSRTDEPWPDHVAARMAGEVSAALDPRTAVSPAGSPARGRSPSRGRVGDAPVSEAFLEAQRRGEEVRAPFMDAMRASAGDSPRRENKQEAPPGGDDAEPAHEMGDAEEAWDGTFASARSGNGGAVERQGMPEPPTADSPAGVANAGRGPSRNGAWDVPPDAPTPFTPNGPHALVPVRGSADQSAGHGPPPDSTAVEARLAQLAAQQDRMMQLLEYFTDSTTAAIQALTRRIEGVEGVAADLRAAVEAATSDRFHLRATASPRSPARPSEQRGPGGAGRAEGGAATAALPDSLGNRGSGQVSGPGTAMTTAMVPSQGSAGRPLDPGVVEEFRRAVDAVVTGSDVGRGEARMLAMMHDMGPALDVLPGELPQRAIRALLRVLVASDDPDTRAVPLAWLGQLRDLADAQDPRTPKVPLDVQYHVITALGPLGAHARPLLADLSALWGIPASFAESFASSAALSVALGNSQALALAAGADVRRSRAAGGAPRRGYAGPSHLQASAPAPSAAESAGGRAEGGRGLPAGDGDPKRSRGDRDDVFDVAAAQMSPQAVGRTSRAWTPDPVGQGRSSGDPQGPGLVGGYVAGMQGAWQGQVGADGDGMRASHAQALSRRSWQQVEPHAGEGTMYPVDVGHNAGDYIDYDVGWPQAGLMGPDAAFARPASRQAPLGPPAPVASGMHGAPVGQGVRVAQQGPMPGVASLMPSRVSAGGWGSMVPGSIPGNGRGDVYPPDATFASTDGMVAPGAETGDGGVFDGTGADAMARLGVADRVGQGGPGPGQYLEQARSTRVSGYGYSASGYPGSDLGAPYPAKPRVASRASLEAPNDLGPARSGPVNP